MGCYATPAALRLCKGVFEELPGQMLSIIIQSKPEVSIIVSEPKHTETKTSIIASIGSRMYILRMHPIQGERPNAPHSSWSRVVVYHRDSGIIQADSVRILMLDT